MPSTPPHTAPTSASDGSPPGTHRTPTPRPPRPPSGDEVAAMHAEILRRRALGDSGAVVLFRGDDFVIVPLGSPVHISDEVRRAAPVTDDVEP